MSAAGRGRRPARVVAFGGGHGLAVSLAALRRVTDAVTAVVTVADDGGSSGRLRQDFGCLPPGDLRMALAALAAADGDGAVWAETFQHRFDAGQLSGHPVGNLVLTALTQRSGDPVQALALAGRVLGLPAATRVLPMAAVPLDIVADVAGLDPDDPTRIRPVRGQVAVATTHGEVVALRLEPESPPAVPEAVQAILDADWVVLGPGSWFTSVLPHLLVPELGKALVETSARMLIVLNLAAQPGETDGFSAETHLEVLAAQAPALRPDAVLADPAAVGDLDALRATADDIGARLVLSQVSVGDGSPRHDPGRLAAGYATIIGDRARSVTVRTRGRGR